ncbi:hypothetical protein IWZ03DRAFT_9193 [Phyllosticta citriasiana]|uniref:Uncharacterized protein n=1 Tax=Phyllosticta citriasiana TaxID=595635 RepID=A0ABR1KZF5_9PEZI
MVEARDKAVVVGHGGWTRHGRSEAGGMTKTGAAAAAFRWLGNSQGIITSCKNPDAIMAWLSRGDSTPTPQAPSLSLSALLSSLSIIMSRTSGVPRKNSGDPHPCRKPLTATSTSVWTGPDFASSSSSSSTTTTKQQQEAHVHDCRPQGARNSSTLPWCRATRTPPPHFVSHLLSYTTAAARQLTQHATTAGATPRRQRLANDDGSCGSQPIDCADSTVQSFVL